MLRVFPIAQKPNNSDNLKMNEMKKHAAPATVAKPLSIRLSAVLVPLPKYSSKRKPQRVDDEFGFSPAQMRSYAMKAIIADRERVCKWIELQRNDIPASGQEFAAALRANS